MISKNGAKAVITIFLFYVVTQTLGITCPIKFLTGVSCAGCGMSRAFLSALKLDFVSAFSFHPLFWLVIPSIIIFLLKDRIPKKIFKICFILIVSCFLVVYFIRMFQPYDKIVVFEPKSGFIYRILNGLIL